MVSREEGTDFAPRRIGRESRRNKMLLRQRNICAEYSLPY